MGRPPTDLTGQRFGHLVAVRRRGTSNSGQALWLCTCDCGATHTVASQALRRGDTKRCPSCTAKFHKHKGALKSGILVELWFYTIGRGGGFATARNRETGTLIAHSHNSRTPLTTQDAAYYPQMRNIAKRLAELGLIEPRNPRYSWLRWYKDEGIEPVAHRAVARERLDALWAECLASGTGPRPDPEHAPLDPKERRHSLLGQAQ